MRFKVHFFANLVGVGWTSLLQLVFVPIYVRLMGVEAYGLIGMYIALFSILQLVDLGLSPTINREMAHAAATGDAARQRNAMRTLEILYVFVAVILSLGVWIAATPIATEWIRRATLPQATITLAIKLMALLLLFQWPNALYQAALIGMQRQIAANAFKAGFATLGAVGAVLILSQVAPTITAFLTWQAAVAAAQLMTAALYAWRSLPPSSGTASFDRLWLREISGFAMGMSGITVAGVTLTQFDKIVLSRMLPLQEFGVYTLAGVLGIGVGIISNAVFLVTYPAFTQLIAQHDDQSLLNLYRRAGQANAALNMAAAAVAVAFSQEILFLWTGDAALAGRAATVMALLAVGTAINGIWKHAYSLQLAYGWTRLALALSWAMVFLAIPSLILIAKTYGAVGAAAIWLALNGVLAFVGLPLTHRVYLRPLQKTWFVDVAGPAVASAAIVALFKFVWPSAQFRSLILLQLLCASVLSLAAATAASGYPRAWTLRTARTLLGRRAA